VLEVDAVDASEEAVHEVLARLLAVADDIQPGILLHLEPEQGRVGLGLLELGTARLPLGPQLLRLGEPRRFGQAACDGGLEHELILGHERGRCMAPIPAERCGMGLAIPSRRER
jgi:hypothetical protein